MIENNFALFFPDLTNEDVKLKTGFGIAIQEKFMASIPSRINDGYQKVSMG